MQPAWESRDADHEQEVHEFTVGEHGDEDEAADNNPISFTSVACNVEEHIPEAVLLLHGGDEVNAGIKQKIPKKYATDCYKSLSYNE